MYKIQTSVAARVRIYSDSNSRSNDQSRPIYTDPTPGSGLLVEAYINSGPNGYALLTPSVIGFNIDSPANTTMYITITNISGGTSAVTATLTVVQLES